VPRRLPADTAPAPAAICYHAAGAEGEAPLAAFVAEAARHPVFKLLDRPSAREVCG
jgi:hypothetical protein